LAGTTPTDSPEQRCRTPPCAPPGRRPPRSRAACAGGRSHSTQDTVISPVPLVPFLAALRVTPPRGSRPGEALFAGQATS